MTIDIIIPNWNGRVWLGECIRSLAAQTFRDFNIIVVDNHSQDDSVAYLGEQFPSVTVLALAENKGFAGSINAGLRAGQAPYVCWFNNDVVAAPDFLENLLGALRAREGEGFALAAARVCVHDRPELLNSAGIFIGPDGYGRERGFLRLDASPYDKPCEIFGPAGAAALFRRVVFHRVGFLDESFFMYGDEDDISFRAQLAGFRCLYVPAARATHRISATANRIKPDATRMACRNQLTVILKNMPGLLLLTHFPLIIVGSLYQMVKFARLGLLCPAWQGKREALQRLPLTWRLRRAAQSLRTISLRHFRRQLRLGRIRPRFLDQSAL